MGCYANPPIDKAAWLEQNGVEHTEVPTSTKQAGEDTLVVCLVDNGPFTAAAIAYNEHELDLFVRPDHRPKRWFSVEVEKLKAVSGLEHYL